VRWVRRDLFLGIVTVLHTVVFVLSVCVCCDVRGELYPVASTHDAIQSLQSLQKHAWTALTATRGDAQ